MLGHIFRDNAQQGSGGTRETSLKGSIYRKTSALHLVDGEVPTLLGSIENLFMLGEWKRGGSCGGVAAVLTQAATLDSSTDIRATAVARRRALGLLDFRATPEEGVRGDAVVFPLAALQPSSAGGSSFYISVPAVPDLLATRVGITLLAAVFLPSAPRLSGPACIVASPKWGLGIDADGSLVGWLRHSCSLTPLPSHRSPAGTLPLQPLAAWWGRDATFSLVQLRSKCALPLACWLEVGLTVSAQGNDAALLLDGCCVARWSADPAVSLQIASASTADADAPTGVSTAPASAPEISPALPFVIGTDLQYAFIPPSTAASGSAAETAVGILESAPPASFARALSILQKRVTATEDAPGGLHDAHAELGAFSAVPQRAFVGLIRDVVLAAGSTLPESDSSQCSDEDSSTPIDATELAIVGHWPCMGAEGLVSDASGGGRVGILRQCPGMTSRPSSEEVRGNIVRGSAPFLGHAFVAASAASTVCRALRLLPRLGLLLMDRCVLPVTDGRTESLGADLPSDPSSRLPPPALLFAGNATGVSVEHAPWRDAEVSDGHFESHIGAVFDSTPRPLAADFDELVTLCWGEAAAASPSTAPPTRFRLPHTQSVRLGFHGVSESWRLTCVDLYTTPRLLPSREGSLSACADDWVVAAISGSNVDASDPSSAAPLVGGVSAAESLFERSRSSLEVWLNTLHAGKHPTPVTPISAIRRAPMLNTWPRPEGSPLSAPENCFVPDSSPNQPQTMSSSPHRTVPAGLPAVPAGERSAMTRICSGVFAVDIAEAPPSNSSSFSARRRLFVVSIVRTCAQNAVSKAASTQRSLSTVTDDSDGKARPGPLLGKRERRSEVGDGAEPVAPNTGLAIGSLVGQGSVWLDEVASTSGGSFAIQVRDAPVSIFTADSPYPLLFRSTCATGTPLDYSQSRSTECLLLRLVLILENWGATLEALV